MTILFKVAAAIQKNDVNLTRKQAIAKAISLYEALEKPAAPDEDGRGTGR